MPYLWRFSFTRRSGFICRCGNLSLMRPTNGDEAWDFDTLAAAFTEVLDRPVEVRRVSTEEHVAILEQAGLDAGTAGFVAALDANIRDGELAAADGTLARLIGRPTTPLVDALRPLA